MLLTVTVSRMHLRLLRGDASDWRVSSDGHTIEEYIGDEVDTLVIPNMTEK